MRRGAQTGFGKEVFYKDRAGEQKRFESASVEAA